MICNYFEHIKDDKLGLAEEIVCDALECLKHVCPSIYNEACFKLHVLAYGEHFNECLAKEFIGEIGEHWTLENTSLLAEKMSIQDIYDFYVLMNMFFHDFSSVLGVDSNTYAKMAKAKLENGCELLKIYLLNR